MSKALFVLEIFNIFVLTFGYVEKRLDKKGKLILKLSWRIYEVTDWVANNYNTYICPISH